MPSLLPYEIISAGGDQLMLWREMVILVSRADPSLEMLEGLEKASLELLEAYPTGIAHLLIVRVNVVPRDPAVRRRMQENMRTHGSRMRAAATVLQGAGLRAVAMRLVLIGLHKVTNNEVPSYFTSDLREALRWLLPRLSGGEARFAELEELAASIELSIRDAEEKLGFRGG